MKSKMFLKIKDAKYTNLKKTMVTATVMFNYGCLADQWIENFGLSSPPNTELIDTLYWQQLLKLTDNGKQIANYTPPSVEELYQQKAQKEQIWVQQELEGCDRQRRYWFDAKRFEYNSIDELNNYVVALRDYVTRNKETDKLTIHGERPIHP